MQPNTLRSFHKHRSHLLNFSEPKFLHTTCYSNTEQFTASKLQSLLSSCSTLHHAKQLHAQFITNELAHTADPLRGPKILGIYITSNSFADAKNLFYRLQLGSAMPWNWMIRALVKLSRFDLALSLYFKMLGSGVSPDKYTFPSVVKACGGLNSVRLGKLVHEMIFSMGFHVDEFVGSSLVKLYAENECLGLARDLFDQLPVKDCVLWNVMLHGFAKCREVESAIKGFFDMRLSGIQPNSVTFACILSVCAAESMVELGAQVHGLVVSSGLEFEPSVGNTLVTMYSKSGKLYDARRLFRLMPETSSVTWNGLVAGYVQNGFMDEAQCLFREMISADVKPDSTTFASFLPSVMESASVRQAKEIHGYIMRHGVTLDVFLTSALIDVYFKCRDVEMAHKMFTLSNVIDIVMFTAMISGYVLNGMNNEAVEIFRWLLREKMRPNAITFASILPACAGLAGQNLGRELHASILKSELDKKCHVGCAVMDMYAKCGRVDLAHQMFRRISIKDTVCWNSIMTSCNQNGKPEVVIDLFRQMRMEGMDYNCVSISVALSACANLPAVHYGKEIHCFMIKGAFRCDIFSESALIDMYGKCGNLTIAWRVFDVMQEKNEVSWNSIVAAYGNHGELEESLVLFDNMLENGFQPDHVTFIGILSACAHAGQVSCGARYFRRMTEEHGIAAMMEHYACMVDLFGRAGRFNEAFETIQSMPFPPDAGIWGTLLGACRVHGNVALAEVAARHLFELDPTNSGYYMLLANIHADAGEWGSVHKIRRMMKEKGVKKVPGYSWIEVDNGTHVFVAGDESHPESAQIHSILKDILVELKREGYVPQVNLPVHRRSFLPSGLASQAIRETNALAANEGY